MTTQMQLVLVQVLEVHTDTVPAGGTAARKNWTNTNRCCSHTFRSRPCYLHFPTRKYGLAFYLIGIFFNLDLYYPGGFEKQNARRLFDHLRVVQGHFLRPRRMNTAARPEIMIFFQNFPYIRNSYFTN
ncbi:unnamed protein product [Amoebophrya sp. A120]|nr:unnamed protein product [Amoebophrya sp. A120]|eukprot:GSA120T00004511001.1